MRSAMAANWTSEWRRLPVSLTELCIATTLRCGQSFRWKHNPTDDSYACVLRGRLVQLKQDAKGLEYRSIWPAGQSPSNKRMKKRTLSGIKTEYFLPTPPSSTTQSLHELDAADEQLSEGEGYERASNTGALLTHYLNLGPNLSDLYASWSDADLNFKKKAPRFTGIRILRQDSWEALVCFICSSNNNIARIGQMVDKLCAEYGTSICVLEGYPGTSRFFDFPGPERLLDNKVESRLRELGFGYRARYIAETARLVHERGGKAWLDMLRNPEAPAYGADVKISDAGQMKPEGRDGYRTAHEALLELQGVGPKVADCVCLMGLAWGEAVPVDTHVWQIAQRDYKFGKGKHSSLTKATYDAVANHFRKLWGQEAGWAHSVLFTADLRVFAERLATKVEVDVKVVNETEGLDGDETKKVIKQEKRIAIKREVDESQESMNPKLEVKEVAMTSSERVKRRRRG